MADNSGLRHSDLRLSFIFVTVNFFVATDWELKFQIIGYESAVTEERLKPECFKPELTAADYGCTIDVQLMCADRTTAVPLIATEKVLSLDL